MPGAFEDRRLGTLTSVAIKAPCKAVTTTAITLNGEQTVGGVACVTGDRVLVSISGGSVNNGIWVVDTGDWSRARDFDGSRDVVKGTFVLVAPGTSNAELWAVYGPADPIVIGSSVIDVRAAGGDAATILLDLANTASDTKGDYLLGVKQAFTGAVARTQHDKNADQISVLDAGSNAAAFTAADSAGTTILVPTGTYTISSNITLSSPVRFQKGAVLDIASGVTVTFNGGIDAGVYQIFSGDGTVVFDAAKQPRGYAEWWGAVSGGSGDAAVNTAAINAALVALMKVELMPADYLHNGTILNAIAGHELTGAGSRYDGSVSKMQTRLVCTSATADSVQLGPSTYPGSVNAMPRGIKMSRICVQRATGPNIPSACSGVLVKYALYGELKDVQTREHVHGIQFFGSVHWKVDDCHSFRSQAGSGGTDMFNGFYVNGSASIGLNGGNASLYLNRCAAEMGGLSIAASAGFAIDGKFTDLFVSQPETSGCATGFSVTGDGGTVWATNAYTNIDLQIDRPILDTFTANGVYITAANKFGSIEILGGYYGAAAGATAAVHVTASAGSVSVTGGQMLMGVATTTYGVRVANSNGVRVSGTQILEATASAVVLDGASNCDIQPLVKNHNNTCAAAVQLFNTCTANYVKPQVMGAASKISLGVQVVGTGDARNEYNVSGIDSGCVASGASNKLVRNGVQITSTGLTGTNLASGVMT